MCTSYQITVRGKPIPTPRPRVVRGHAFTPGRAKAAQTQFGLAWLEKYGKTKISGPIRAEIEFVFTPPASWSKKKTAQALAGDIPATGHNLGDLDNLIKTATDGLNLIAFDDDSQIMTIYATKRYGNTAKTTVTLKGANNETDN